MTAVHGLVRFGTRRRDPSVGFWLAFAAVAALAACESGTEPPRPNRPPVAVGIIPDQTMVAGLEGVGLALAGYFDDPDGDALVYAAMSTDPAIATVEVMGSSLLIEGVAAGKATVTVVASDPGGLVAAQSTGVTVKSPNQPPVAIGCIPTQDVTLGTSVNLDVSPYFDDPDGDTLIYEATSDNSAVAAAGATGSDVTIMGLAEGPATVTVVASDPEGLSARQAIAVVVSAGTIGLRDDFDDAALPGWTATNADAVVSDGILRVTGTLSGAPGQADRALVPKLVDWRTRALVARAHDDAAVRMTFATNFPNIPRIAVELGPGVAGQDTNVRFMIQDASGQWQIPGGASSDAVPDDAGEFVEVDVSIQGTLLAIRVGDTEVYTENLLGAPIDLLTLTEVGLWVVPLGDTTGRAALVDWIEVTGKPSA